MTNTHKIDYLIVTQTIFALTFDKKGIKFPVSYFVSLFVLLLFVCLFFLIDNIFLISHGFTSIAFHKNKTKRIKQNKKDENKKQTNK